MSCDLGVFVIKDFDQDVLICDTSPSKARKSSLFVTASLVDGLQQSADEKESWALHQVQPGIVIEERLTYWKDDSLPAIEFKTFTIWGRVWLSIWKRGCFIYGFVHRNGTLADPSSTFPIPDRFTELPHWIEWERVVNIAETLGAHKDMYRTDIFVGVPAGTVQESSLDSDSPLMEVQYLVSETEIYPTTIESELPAGFDEAVELWLQGYRDNNYITIPNRDISRETE